MAAIALGAMACSNNNEPGTEPVVLNGTYDGLVSMSVMGKNMGNSFVSFKVTSVSDGVAKLTVPELGSGPMTISSFDIEDVSVVKEGNTYKISKKENESIVVNEVNYTVSDVEGTVENGKADIHLKITPAAMGMAISLDFTTEYAADAVVGKWAGNLNMTVEMGGGKTMEMEPLAMTLTVEKIDDNTVTVTTEEFAAMENMTIPAFTIEDVAAAKAGGNTVTLSKDDFSMVIGGSNYKFTSFTGEYSKGVFTLHFGMTPDAMAAMGMKISCTFTTATSAEEE